MCIASQEVNSQMEHQEWKNYSPSDLGAAATYNLGISAVVPRPVAVITSIPSNTAELTTDDSGVGVRSGDPQNLGRSLQDDAVVKEEKTPSEDGNDQRVRARVVNCAPFSYTGLLSHDPPMVAHGICLQKSRQDGKRKKKDTLVNIEQSKEWVFNVLSESYLEQANACSEALPYGVSEVQKNNLSTLPSVVCKTPRLAQAMVSMECVLESTKELYNDAGEHTTTIVMGKIVQYHIHSSVLKESDAKGSMDNSASSSGAAAGIDRPRPVVDLEKLQSVGRAGDITYWPTGSEGKAVPMRRP